MSKKQENPVEAAYKIIGTNEVDIKSLKKLGSSTNLHMLDILPLLPFTPKGNTNTGRTLNKMITETLDEQLSEKERYTRIAPSQYLLYLGTNEKLAKLKIEIINKEISRKIEQFIQGRYASKDDSPGSEAKTPKSPPASKPNANEKWRPEVEPAPRRLTSDPDKRKMADDAMREMLRTREKESSIKNYHLFSKEIVASYTPVWNVPKNYLTGFIAKPCALTLDPKESSFIKMKADVDIGLLVLAGAELNAMLSTGNKIVLIVPVSLSTLDRHPSRNLFIQYCRNISPEIRSLMVLKIQDIHPDTPIYKLQDLLREPSGLMRSLIISTDLRQKRYEAPAGCHIHAFSASLTDAPVSEKKSFGLLDGFAAMIQSVNHASMIEDIPNRPLLCAAIGSGLTYVSGPAVQSAQDTLDMIRPFDLADVYRTLKSE